MMQSSKWTDPGNVNKFAARRARPPDSDVVAALQWLASHHADGYVRAVASAAATQLPKRRP